MEAPAFSVSNYTCISCNNDTMLNLPAINDTYLDYYYVDVDVTFWQTPQLIILIVLFVFIVFGNLIVLLAIGLSKTGRKTRMHFFIVNLAISDLTVGVFHVTVDIAERLLVEWHGGSILCKIVRFLQVMVVYASTFMIVSLSIDRVDAIARPMNFTRKATTMRALVNAAWITSGVLSIPSFLLSDTFDHTSGLKLCMIVGLHETWHWQLYITLVALTTFIIPALIIAVCYGIILFVIWDKGRGFQNSLNSPCRNNNPVANGGGNKGIIPQAKIKTIKMTLIIVCVFIFSWSPYFVFNLIDVYSGTDQPKSTAHLAVTSLVQSLAPLNSAVNPIIYGLFGTRICQNLRRIPCIGYLYSWFCQCRIKQRKLTNLQPNSEQTNIDVPSGKNVSTSKRGYRYLVKVNSTHGGIYRPIGLESTHNGNKTRRNGIKRDMNYHVVPSDVTPTDYPTSESEFCFRRRLSGLPVVNRKMTDQETILLETYRSAGENINSDNEIAGKDILENKAHFEGATEYINNIPNSLNESGTCKSQISKVSGTNEGVHVEIKSGV